jgi:glucosamine--fructose-6-phosphate aminotransferase (isomerizing)
VTGFAIEGHIAAQPETVARLLAEPHEVTVDAERPVVFTGIGTSLHACRIAASWVRLLTGGALRPAAIDAHDLALTEPITARDQIVVVSHRGTKRYPNEVLRRGRQAGASTVAITGLGPAMPVADTIMRTCEQERASTHTESYTAALAILAQLVCRLVGDPAAEFTAALRDVPEAMRRTLELPIAESAVDALVTSESEPAIVAGTGLDAITADEAALKLKEGTYRWVEGMHSEFALHGTPAVYRPSMVAYLIRSGMPDGGRGPDLAALLRRLEATVLHCADDDHAELPFAPTHPLTRPFVNVLPFQRLVCAAATRLGANPDLTHLEAEPWATAIKEVTL